MGVGNGLKERLARRAAQEVEENTVVNLGIGIPSLVPDYLPGGFPVLFQSENGIIGIGEAPGKGREDPALCNAGGYPVTLVKGGAFTDSAVAFAMIRRGLIDLTILGSLQVSGKGDLANWIIPGKKVPGMGGATELAACARRVIVVMTHTDKFGGPKILGECTLPLTARECVSMIITDQAVFRFENGEMVLKEIFKPFTIEDIRSSTEAEFSVDPHMLFVEG